jgi:hypothetical protein
MFPVFAICLILRLPNITVLLPYVLSYGILLYNGYLEQQYKHLIWMNIKDIETVELGFVFEVLVIG